MRFVNPLAHAEVGSKRIPLIRFFFQALTGKPASAVWGDTVPVVPVFVPALVSKSAIALWRWLVIMWAYRMVI